VVNVVKQKVSKKKVQRAEKSFKPSLNKMRVGDNLVVQYSDQFSIHVAKTKEGYCVSPSGTSNGLLFPTVSDVETALEVLMTCFAEGARAVADQKNPTLENNENLKQKISYIS
jgi:hypothetical protein